MKKFFAAFVVLALLAGGAGLADDKKAAEPTKAPACCSPKCELKEGKCATKEAGKCTKECDKPCCKPAKKPEHPGGDHPKGDHPK